MAIIDDDNIEISDPTAWGVITALGGADLVGGDRPYLYGTEDFIAWENELGAGGESTNGVTP